MDDPRETDDVNEPPGETADRGEMDAGREGANGQKSTRREGETKPAIRRRESSSTGRGDRRESPSKRRRENGGRGETGVDDEWVLFVRDVVTSVLAVALVGGYLFAVSGVFPPMVAIESGSMTPNMEVNDLVFVMDEDRFPPEAAHGDTGIVTAETGREVGYEQFGGHGDVIIFAPSGDERRTPVIHRAMFWVEDGERWYDRADEEYVGTADSCEELSGCPADHAGFITKGDSNPRYDQAGFGQLNEPVRPEWVIGTAEVRIPGLGWLRLRV